MKKILFALAEILRTFIIILGVQFLLLILRAPYEFPNDDINRYEMQDCILSAAVFAVTHVFVFSDYITEKMPVIYRCLISFIPCEIVAVRLVYQFTKVSLLGLRGDEYSRSVQTFDMYFSYVAGSLILLLVLFIIELQFKRIGKEYDEALQRYKQKQKDMGGL